MARIQPPPYQSEPGSFAWQQWYRIINELLSNISTSIDNIDDITITSVGDNEFLSYDSGSSKWINQTLTELGIVLDTSPQLGGDLDLNGNVITGLVIGTDIQAWDTILDGTTASYTSAEETKLAGIEPAADVTDATNVAAAGALMDSEVDADIKTLVLPASTTISAAGAALIDDADAAAQRVTLDVSPVYTQVRDAVGLQSLSTSAVTLNLDTIDVETPGDFTLATDAVTFNTAGTYKIEVQVSAEQIDTLGLARTAVTIQAQEDVGAGFVDITDIGFASAYAREASGGPITATLVFIRAFAATDDIRIQVTSPLAMNIQTVVGLSRMIITRLGA